METPVCPTCHRKATMGSPRTGYIITPLGRAALEQWRAKASA